VNSYLEPVSGHADHGTSLADRALDGLFSGRAMSVHQSSDNRVNWFNFASGLVEFRKPLNNEKDEQAVHDG
jgi:hypothetical protein